MDTGQQALTLGQGDILRIRDGRGLLVRVAQGRIWLTEEGDRRDIMLGPNQSFRLERAGLALVYAFEPAALSLSTATRGERAAPLGQFGLIPARVAG